MATSSAHHAHRSSTGVPISYGITRLSRAIGNRLQAMHLTLSGPQVAALLALRHESGLSNAQLSRRCYVAPQSMHEVILGLERKGLITRAQDPANRRILRAQLTDKARAVLADWDEAIAEVEDAVFDGLSDAEIAAFAGVVDRCVANMRLGRD
jgi:DNA-binding MarR family transcriptional regulator